MIDRLKSKTAVGTVASLVAALGVGGVALAQNNSGGSTPPHAAQAKVKPTTTKRTSDAPGQESNAPDSSAGDRDNVQSGDQTKHLALSGGVQPEGRLVEEDDGGIVDQRPHDAEPLAHAAAVGPDL